MNARRLCVRLVTTIIFTLIAFEWRLADVAAQRQIDQPAERARRANRIKFGLRKPYDGANPANETDVAVGSFVDSLFSPFAPADPLPEAAAKAVGVKPSSAARRPNLVARLVHNPDTSDGNPPYALADRYGGIVRYVEPMDNVDLDQHVGQTVRVRRDTGHTLLATQLDLPRTARNTANPTGIQLAAFQDAENVPTPADAETAPEPIPAGDPSGTVIESYDGFGDAMIVPEGVDPLYLDEGVDFGGVSCDTCGSMICGGACGFGSRPIWYVRGEYLLWWFKGMDTPPLVVEGNDDGNGNFVDAVIVYGNAPILQDSRDGGRITVGTWFDDFGKWGLEGDYLAFNDLTEGFVAGGDGVTPPFVGRPFIDALNGINAVQDVSFPGIMGNVFIDSSSSFESAGVRLRHNLCCVAGCATGCGDAVSCGSVVGGCDSCTGGVGCGAMAGAACPIRPLGRICDLIGRGTRHTDITMGVRWTQLDESILIREDLTVIETPPQTTLEVNDAFSTSNEFFGGELGFIWEWELRRWSLELLSRLAIGNTQQTVRIAGSTTRNLNDGSGPTTEIGGLLAQRSNIGVYERDEFSMIPELGVTAGYLLTDRLRFTVGYSLIYWSNVVRPGDQMDLVIDTDQVPRFDGSSTTALLPQFIFRQSDLWAQGVNFGFDYRY